MTNQANQTLYTVSIFSENHVGLLNQISTIFTRRCVNIESVSASRTSIPGVHKISLTAYCDRPLMEKIVKILEKRVEVLRAFLYSDADLVYQEVALYKVPTQKLLYEQNLENIIRHHNARILEITPVYTVIEKTGHEDETEALFEELKRYDIRQFVRSGRIGVTKDPDEYVDAFLRRQQLRLEKMNHPSEE